MELAKISLGFCVALVAEACSLLHLGFVAVILRRKEGSQIVYLTSFPSKY